MNIKTVKELKGGSQPKWYEALGKYRLLGLYGNDGTGNKPIPSSCFYQCFIHEGARNMGLNRAFSFSIWSVSFWL